MSPAVTSNDAMVAGRFARWAEARRRFAWIQARLAEGRTVYLHTHTRVTAYKAKHAAMFKATRSGLYVARGKGWDCILSTVGLTASEAQS